MKSRPNLGDQEIQILRYIDEHSPVSVREVAIHFDQELGLARTTILTVMERLRKKGYLLRNKTDGIFKYSVRYEQETVLKGKVADFIEKTLGGSINPLLNYFLDSPHLTQDELEQLKKMASKIHKKEEK